MLTALENAARGTPCSGGHSPLSTNDTALLPLPPFPLETLDFSCRAVEEDSREEVVDKLDGKGDRSGGARADEVHGGEQDTVGLDRQPGVLEAQCRVEDSDGRGLVEEGRQGDTVQELEVR